MTHLCISNWISYSILTWDWMKNITRLTLFSALKIQLIWKWTLSRKIYKVLMKSKLWATVKNNTFMYWFFIYLLINLINTGLLSSHVIVEDVAHRMYISSLFRKFWNIWSRIFNIKTVWQIFKPYFWLPSTQNFEGEKWNEQFIKN